MIKRAVKSVLWRTGISRKVPPMFWKSVKTGDNIKYQSLDVRHPSFPVNFENPEINASFIRQNAKFAEVKDYLLEVTGNILIEPKLGIAILGHGKFLEQTRNHTYTYPDTMQYLKYRMGMMPVVKMDEVIHFDGYVGDNYYNFYADVLCPFLWAVEKGGLKVDKPLLIGKRVYNMRYFQWLLNNNEWFKNLPWYVIDGTSYIQVKKLYKGVIFLQNEATWRYASKLFNAPVVANPAGRMFLYREAKFGRGVKNMEEVKPLLKKYGFEMVDTGNMTLNEQTQLFANTRYLIAVHGAGITNILFSDPKQLSLLEILPGREKLNTHYYWMGETLGCKYDAILTEDMNAAKKFNLDITVLEHHINKMLAQ